MIIKFPVYLFVIDPLHKHDTISVIGTDYMIAQFKILCDYYSIPYTHILTFYEEIFDLNNKFDININKYIKIENNDTKNPKYNIDFSKINISDKTYKHIESLSENYLIKNDKKNIYFRVEIIGYINPIEILPQNFNNINTKINILFIVPLKLEDFTRKIHQKDYSGDIDDTLFTIKQNVSNDEIKDLISNNYNFDFLNPKICIPNIDLSYHMKIYHGTYYLSNTKIFAVIDENKDENDDHIYIDNYYDNDIGYFQVGYIKIDIQNIKDLKEKIEKIV